MARERSLIKRRLHQCAQSSKAALHVRHASRDPYLRVRRRCDRRDHASRHPSTARKVPVSTAPAIRTVPLASVTSIEPGKQTSVPMCSTLVAVAGRRGAPPTPVKAITRGGLSRVLWDSQSSLLSRIDVTEFSSLLVLHCSFRVQHLGRRRYGRNSREIGTLQCRSASRIRTYDFHRVNQRAARPNNSKQGLSPHARPCKSAKTKGFVPSSCPFCALARFARQIPKEVTSL